MRKIIRIGFKTKKIRADKQDIDEFFQEIDNRRKITSSQVNSILRSLVSGKNFDAPFVINYKGGMYRLIDGNHRFEATKKYLDANPDHKVDITLHIYDNLSDADEKRLYSQYNIGKKQSTNDFVQLYKDTIPLWAMMQRTQMPIRVTVYPSTKSISFYKVVSVYITAIKPGNFSGGFLGKPAEFIEQARLLGEKDLINIKIFLDEYLKSFGVFQNNRWFNSTPFTAVMRIWMKNKDNMMPEKMVRFFKEKLAMDYEATDLHKVTGASSTIYAMERYIAKLNNGRTRDLFIGN